MTTYSVPLTYSRAIQLQVTLDGANYQAVIGWNQFGQRSYITINDLYGNRVLTLPLIGSSKSTVYSYTISDPSGVQAAKKATLATNTPINIVGGYFSTSTMYFYPSDQTLVVTP